MKLTTQQEQAMLMIKEFISSSTSQVFILKGYAGTGKTTLINEVVKYIQGHGGCVQLMAPTGRAAKVLKNKIKSSGATTIHRGIYEFERLDIREEDDKMTYIFPLKETKTSHISIIDEASMISSKENSGELFQFGTSNLLNDLLTYSRMQFGGKIIFVGDPMQLPPVGDNQSKALEESYFKNINLSVASYELSDVIRQDKDSAILTNATKIRELVKNNVSNELVVAKRDGEVMDLSAMQVPSLFTSNNIKSSAIICFTNKLASQYNSAIRKIIYPDAKHVMVGDKLMVVNNSYFKELELLNGSIIEVVEISDNIISLSAPVWTEINGEKKKVNISLDFREIKFQTEDGGISTRYIIDSLLENKNPGLTIDEMKALYINCVMRIKEDLNITSKDREGFVMAVKDDPFYSALHVKYGYAFTCHKSQGGEWDDVYVDFSKQTGLDVSSMRWKYTAITRATSKLWCINLPDITPMSTLKINPIIRTSKIPNNSLSIADYPTTPYHISSSNLSLRAKYWSVVSALEGTSYSIKNVSTYLWMERYEVLNQDVANTVDCIYNGAGIFTSYKLRTPNEELLEYFNNDTNTQFDIKYYPKLEMLDNLYHRIISLCDEEDITLTNVVEGNYNVAFYMRTSGIYAVITFYYNNKGFITYGAPASYVGEDDIKLQNLIKKLK